MRERERKSVCVRERERDCCVGGWRCHLKAHTAAACEPKKESGTQFLLFFWRLAWRWRCFVHLHHRTLNITPNMGGDKQSAGLRTSVDAGKSYLSHLTHDSWFGGKTIGFFGGVALLINNITGPGETQRG